MLEGRVDGIVVGIGGGRKRGDAEIAALFYEDVAIFSLRWVPA